jgi:hypothetical protein
MRIVVGCPVVERGWILPQYLGAIEAQQVYADVVVVCLYTQSRDNTLDVLKEHDVDVVPGLLPPRPRERLRDHIWSYDAGDYRYMTTLRNMLLSYVISTYEPDWFFSLDSDVLLSTKGVLRKLLICAEQHEANAVAPLVNVAKEPPPAWNYMHLRGSTAQRFRDEPLPVAPFKTDVIMAACMQDRVAQRVGWADHPQGEDVGWAVRAHSKGVKAVVDPRIVCAHAMRDYG